MPGDQLGTCLCSGGGRHMRRDHAGSFSGRRRILVSKGVFAAYLIIVGAGSAQADGAPSYEQTVQFLQEKLNTQISADVGRQDNSFVEISRCEFESRQFFASTEGRQSDVYQMTVMKMGDADPGKISVNSMWQDTVDIVATRNLEKFEFIKVNGEDASAMRDKSSAKIKSTPGIRKTMHETSVAPIGRILSPASDNAPRVQKALIHLAKICGGKVELF